MVTKQTKKKTSSSNTLKEKRERVQRLAREYNTLVHEYNELSRKNWATAQKHTSTGEAAAKRLVKKYNQLAAKGRMLEKAVITYKNARKKAGK